MQVYPLVEDSPVKTLGKQLEKLIEQYSSDSEESEDETLNPVDGILQCYRIYIMSADFILST